MKKRSSRFCSYAAFVACLLAGANQAQAGNMANSPNHYKPYVSVGGYYFSETPRSAVSVDLFYPFYQKANCMFYVDARGLDKSRKAWEGNLGLGYRMLYPTEQRIVGAYAFFDRKRSPLGHYFSQATLGGEFWQGQWSVGGNVYIPFGTTKYAQSSLNQAQLTGTGLTRNISYNFGRDVAYAGVDVLAGYEWKPGFIGYIGGYYFNRSDYPKVTGPMARVVYHFKRAGGKKVLAVFSRVNLLAEYQHDDERKNLWTLGVKADISIGRNAMARSPMYSGVARHMDEQVIRDIDVISLGTIDPAKVLNAADGQPVQVAIADNAADLATAADDATKDVIRVQGSVSVDSATVDLEANQTLTGGNYVFTVGNDTFTLPVSTGGTIVGTGSVVEPLANDTIRDITLTTAAGQKAIDISPASGTDMGTVRIEGVTVTEGGVDVTLAGAGALTLDFKGNKVTTTSGVDAVHITNGGSTVMKVSRFEGNTLAATALNALDLAGTGGVTFENGIKSNTFTATDTTASILITPAATKIIMGDIEGNTGTLSTGTFFSYDLDAALTVDISSIKNNTVGAISMVGGTLTIGTTTGGTGITGNTFSGGLTFDADLSASAHTISGFHTNEFGTGVTTPITISNTSDTSGSTTTLTVGQGTTTLKNANTKGGAVLSTNIAGTRTGTTTLTPTTALDN